MSDDELAGLEQDGAMRELAAAAKAALQPLLDTDRVAREELAKAWAAAKRVPVAAIGISHEEGLFPSAPLLLELRRIGRLLERAEALRRVERVARVDELLALMQTAERDGDLVLADVADAELAARLGVEDGDIRPVPGEDPLVTIERSRRVTRQWEAHQTARIPRETREVLESLQQEFATLTPLVSAAKSLGQTIATVGRIVIDEPPASREPMRPIAVA